MYMYIYIYYNYIIIVINLDVSSLRRRSLPHRKCLAAALLQSLALSLHGRLQHRAGQHIWHIYHLARNVWKFGVQLVQQRPVTPQRRCHADGIRSVLLDSSFISKVGKTVTKCDKTGWWCQVGIIANSCHIQDVSSIYSQCLCIFRHGCLDIESFEAAQPVGRDFAGGRNKQKPVHVHTWQQLAAKN